MISEPEARLKIDNIIQEIVNEVDPGHVIVDSLTIACLIDSKTGFYKYVPLMNKDGPPHHVTGLLNEASHIIGELMYSTPVLYSTEDDEDDD